MAHIENRLKKYDLMFRKGEKYSLDLSVPEIPINQDLQKKYGVLGETSLPPLEFSIAINQLHCRMRQHEALDKFLSAATAINPVMKKPGIYFRGRVYYYHLESYYTNEVIEPAAGWVRGMQLTTDALQELARQHVQPENIAERVIILALLDHMKDSSLRLQNAIHRSSIQANRDEQMFEGWDSKPREYSHEILQAIDTQTEQIIRAFYRTLCFSDNNMDYSFLEPIMNQRQEFFNLAHDLEKYLPKGFREFDNPVRATRFGVSIARAIHDNGKKYSALIGIREGGAELPYIVNAFYEMLYGCPVTDNILSMYYSVYRHDRLRRIDSFYNKFPPHQRHVFDTSSLTLLILDNNSYSFSTVSSVKNIIATEPRISDYDIAVAEVAFKHIADTLPTSQQSDLKRGAPVQDWEGLLDYNPIGQYISCYDFRGIINREARRLLRTEKPQLRYHVNIGAFPQDIQDVIEKTEPIALLGGNICDWGRLNRKAITQFRRLFLEIYNARGHNVSFISHRRPLIIDEMYEIMRTQSGRHGPEHAYTEIEKKLNKVYQITYLKKRMQDGILTLSEIGALVSEQNYTPHVTINTASSTDAITISACTHLALILPDSEENINEILKNIFEQKKYRQFEVILYDLIPEFWKKLYETELTEEQRKHIHYAPNASRVREIMEVIYERKNNRNI